MNRKNADLVYADRRTVKAELVKPGCFIESMHTRMSERFVLWNVKTWRGPEDDFNEVRPRLVQSIGTLRDSVITEETWGPEVQLYTYVWQ